MRTLTLLFIIILVICSLSCTYKSACITPTTQSMDFTTNADSIPDTGASITQYKKGSNFSNPIASLNMITGPQSPPHSKLFYFPNSGKDVYNYDWIITLIPSGKLYKLQNIAHSDNYEKSRFLSGPVKDFCVNSVTYIVNGSAYNSSLSRGTDPVELMLTVGY